MATTGATIRRPCTYNLGAGNSPNILKGQPFPIGGHFTFNVQVFITGINEGATGKLYLLLSNDGENFVPSGDEVTISGLDATEGAVSYIIMPSNPNAAAAVYLRVGVKGLAGDPEGTITSALFSAL